MEPIPNAMIAAANAKSRQLRELVRAPEILVMPGAYDVLSALQAWTAPFFVFNRLGKP